MWTKVRFSAAKIQGNADCGLKPGVNLISVALRKVVNFEPFKRVPVLAILLCGDIYVVSQIGIGNNLRALQKFGEFRALRFHRRKAHSFHPEGGFFLNPALSHVN
jgi:hypothetical protein